MPRRPVSNRVKVKQDEAFERYISDAKTDLATGKCLTIPEAAEMHRVAESTLRNRLKGKRSRQECRIGEQALTPAEENPIKEWVFKLDDWGFPSRHQYVKDMALDFIKSHDIQSQKLGKNWMTRFLSRHPDLASKFCTRLDKQRAYADNPEILEDFYETLLIAIREHGIVAGNMYNMDEKGFLMGRSARVKVILRRGKKRNFKSQDGTRKLITVIEAVSAAGTTPPPMIIYQGEAQYAG
ncbi:uncharacterized protein H6S33_009630 [Morchella sextelata]|uniref:uncharacterized protein n=1 Tax=Morchella sextelata TaxID=1174677 RepID=UPI001D055E80|nr:uncharacterized protein H6S33_009630 [Morchella sextelata]KAH0613250.1 hypothetical protein H6S33_009630 [Morchella sextelata]